MKYLSVFKLTIFFSIMVIINSCNNNFKATRDDIVGLWLLRVTENSPRYLQDIRKGEGFVREEYRKEVITFHKDGMYEGNVGMYSFAGKWTIENEQLIVYYDLHSDGSGSACDKLGSKIESKVSLDGFSKNENGILEGMIEMIYMPRDDASQCDLVQIPIYKEEN